MFILHCIPISAMNRLLFHSACTDENHMLNEGPVFFNHSRETQRPDGSSSSSTLTHCADGPESQDGLEEARRGA